MESRVRENRSHGSEGAEAKAFPTPIESRPSPPRRRSCGTPHRATATSASILTLVDRGADALAFSGRIGAPLAQALEDEARSRVAQGRFFGHIAYFSLHARKPSPA